MLSEISKDSARQIASLLLSAEHLTAEQFNQAVAASDESGRGLMGLLLEFGFVTEDKISQTISEAYDLERLHLSGLQSIQKEALELLPEQFILENRIVPYLEWNGILSVAISEPEALSMISSVRVITEKNILATVISFSEMNTILRQLSGKNKSTNGENEIQSSQADSRSSKLKGRKDQSTRSKDQDAHSSIVITFVNQMLMEAIKAGGSDIHLEPYKKSCRVRFRVDGVLHDRPDLDQLLFEHYAAVVTRIKIMASLDIAERRLPQDGAISLEVEDREVDLRVSILPTNFGERVVMRILDRSALTLTLENLGFLEEDELAFKAAVDAPQGLVLVTGPTGSGKSTTLYAALGRVNRDDVNILTAEDPVEYAVEGVGQVQIKEEIGLTFSSVLRSFLRQDPEIILVGEIRDKETGDIAIKSALTGHLVLSTLHTNDAVSTITRLLNMGIPSYLITSSLTLVVAQRLARKICPSCKESDDSLPESNLRTVGFTVEEISRINVYRGRGCDLCNHTGYKGRQGIYEVLRITDTIKQGILDELTTSELLALAKEKDNFSTMQDVGRGMLVQGIITVDEYHRVLMSN